MAYTRYSRRMDRRNAVRGRENHPRAVACAWLPHPPPPLSATQFADRGNVRQLGFGPVNQFHFVSHHVAEPLQVPATRAASTTTLPPHVTTRKTRHDVTPLRRHQHGCASPFNPRRRYGNPTMVPGRGQGSAAAEGSDHDEATPTTAATRRRRPRPWNLRSNPDNDGDDNGSGDLAEDDAGGDRQHTILYLHNTSITNKSPWSL
ncbi:hypothetical protein EDB85DRAFT_1896946 [Lactarius pseudohatsudake]|nr:hypothetical protein EDB85DRAFT_1896946 [Lactarius pseudohatsudake]